MNIVYPYKHFNPAELIYSLKSLKNYKDAGEVFIIGDSPRNDITGFTLLEHEPATWAGSSRYHDVTSKIYQYAKTHTGDFLLLNDDIFLLSDYTPTNYQRGALLDLLREGEMTSFKQSQVYMLNWLRRQGLPLQSYELHVPMVINCEKAIETIELMAGTIQFGNILMFRTVYGNMHLTDAKQLNDVKNIADYYGKPLLSTDEQTFEHGEIGKYIKTVLDDGKATKPKPIKPKTYTVDVVIPVFNGASTIIDCLDSLPKHKTIKNIIVCDDKSTDDTLKLLKAYKGRTITILQNEHNRGVGYTFNKLLDAVKSDYILRVDADDKVRPEMNQVLDQITGQDIIYYNMVDNDGTVRRCNQGNKRLLVANFHIYKTSLIGDTRTIETNWGEDAHFLHALLAKNPTELFTDINAYSYNYPRADSLTGKRKSRKKYLLAVMSNATNDCLTNPTIYDTIQSWKDTFGEPENIAIYLDPNPNPQLLDEYVQQIKDRTGIDPIITKSLSDGYRRALDENYEFIFYLEHDWQLQGIHHSLGDILGTMKTDKRWFMLFNQHRNIDDPRLAKWQSYLKPHNRNYCLTDRISNNPHIIWREMYRSKCLHLVDWTVKGAGLIEQVLEKKFEVAVYGEYDKEPTIVHTDGRKKGAK